MLRLLSVEENATIRLKGRGLHPEQAHVFEKRAIDAVNTALAAGRPLLVRGEPGTGKSQLARAVAHELKMGFVQRVVDAHTDVRDLFCTFDAVARLAKAQLMGAANLARPESLRTDLSTKHFVAPGVLWWAFDWDSAAEQAELAREVEIEAPVSPEGWQAQDGCVVLLDELDKAESAVPNGLLEALGEGEFSVPADCGERGRVRVAGMPPLVVITTNEERALPDAFLRRCVVLPLSLPPSEDALIQWLVVRGRAHFPEGLSDVTLIRAAKMLAADRQEMRNRGLSPPGQAEYLDMLRAVKVLAETSHRPAEAIMDEVAQYVLRKHPEDVLP